MEYSESPEGQYAMEQEQEYQMQIERERLEFLEDLKSLCKKHDVEMCCDFEELESSGAELPYFYGRTTASGHSWCVDIGDIHREIQVGR